MISCECWSVCTCDLHVVWECVFLACLAHDLVWCTFDQGVWCTCDCICDGCGVYVMGVVYMRWVWCICDGVVYM